MCGLCVALSLPGSGNHRALCWGPLLEMTEFPGLLTLGQLRTPARGTGPVS